MPYAIPNQSIRSVDFATHVRTGTWRAVAHTQHAFWTESFVDELATPRGQDPYEYRRALLRGRLRAKGKCWKPPPRKQAGATPLPAGHGRGIAIAESYGTIAAHVVEASIGEDGAPRVHRVVAAVDCGTVVHPDTARQQVEGAILMGLGAALFEEITIEDGAVVQANFPDYPIMTHGSRRRRSRCISLPATGRGAGSANRACRRRRRHSATRCLRSPASASGRCLFQRP